MISAHRKYLEQRCLERGYEISEVMACVLSMEGDIWVIDEDHPSYPRDVRLGALSFKCVPDCTVPEFACSSGNCCNEQPDGSNLCEPCCPAYPVTCYRTGGAANSGGYSSVEVQCVDAKGVRVFDARGSNGGGFGGTWSFAGCGASAVGTISGPNGASVSVCWGSYCISVGPGSLTCCAGFGGGGSWCDNPIGSC